VYVSGTIAVDDEGRIAPPGDPYGQARRCLQIIAGALAEAGASITDVVRTRMYVLDPGHWVEVGRAHGEMFGETKPATTLVAVAGLVDPDALVEIEAVAVVG
jgi:enamine deaminase RidA (YjgF/YER057c/UK114 family)